MASGFLVCKVCGYRGSIRGRVPMVLPGNTRAQWRSPFERSIGKNWRSWAQTNGWDQLVLRVMNVSNEVGNDVQLNSSVFKRAVFKSSDYYYYKWAKPKEMEAEENDYAPIRDTLITKILSYAPRRLLEIGCGSGHLISSLMKWRPTGTLTVGLDIDYERVKLLEGKIRRAEAEKYVMPVNGDSRVLPFPEEHFDVAVSFLGLTHVEGVNRALAETIRVIKRGGRFLAVEPYSGSTLHLKKELGELTIHMLRQHFKLHHGITFLSKMFLKMGLSVDPLDEFNVEDNRLIFFEVIRN
ncbi:class I SAM-dependent methyltransferase [bacterium]|nr:class I SAM-dependent methyltransferase [candidate division CSSED10-310 bacterium]